MADEEQARLEELRQTKLAALHQLDRQAETLGAFTPPYIHLERKRLRSELGMVEQVILSPLGSDISDELGEKWRFVAYLEKVGQLDLSIKRLEARVSDFIEASMHWRRWTTWALLVIIVIIVVIVIIGAFWLGRLAR